MPFKSISHVALGAAFFITCIAPAAAQTAADEIAKYRQLLADDNPAELSEAKGEELWKTPRGPKKATLEACDLGLGPGVVKGAYVQMPRYFADTAKVQEVESRLVTCMITLQGMSEAEARKNPFGPNNDMQAQVAYIPAQTKRMKIAQPISHQQQKEP